MKFLTMVCRFLWFRLLIVTLGLSAPAFAAAPDRSTVLDTMRRAAEFMVEQVSHEGGYVWSYLPDFSRRWGEMEAYPTMAWVQPPGTGTMGHLFLDAYYATGDEYYYKAAAEAAGALIRGQHPSGGWNYMIDFAGEDSLRKWYDTIGRNGWRLEEFQYYYGNATFDDSGTAEAAKLLLRLYLVKRDPVYKPALEKAVRFILDSQYPIGGWPQRYPLPDPESLQGKPEYPSYITFNDDVAAENMEFLVMYYQALNEIPVLDAIVRGMTVFIVTQLGQPQPGWAEQYTLDLQPAGARSYEPKALSTSITANNVRQLMEFYRMTGETRFLARIPEALDWLDSVRLSRKQAEGDRRYPTFVELGSNKPLFLYRRGSNVVNGEYYVDYKPGNTLLHYRSARLIDVKELRAQYRALRKIPPEKVAAGSPLKTKERMELPRYFTLQKLDISDPNSRFEGPRPSASPSLVAKLIGELNRQGYWPTPLLATTNPYIGPGSKAIAPGDFSGKNVGDKYDTSPYVTDEPVIGISTGMFIRNMSLLIEYLDTEMRRQN